MNWLRRADVAQQDALLNLGLLLGCAYLEGRERDGPGFRLAGWDAPAVVDALLSAGLVEAGSAGAVLDMIDPPKIARGKRNAKN